MKKVVKILIGIVVVLLILLAGFILSLPLTIGPLVKNGAAAAGPKVLGVDISVGDVKLKPVAGQLIITDLKIGNPEGYTENDSFAVKTVDVELKTRSLFSGDTIYIKKILIDSPEILYEVQKGTANFDKMLEKAKTAEKTEDSKSKMDGEKKPGKKVVIEEFVLKGSKVAYASKFTLNNKITVPLPPVKVNGIGEKSGGVTAVEAVSEVVAAMVGSLKDAVTKVVTDTTALGTDAVNKGVDAATDVAEKAEKTAKDAADKAGKAAKDAAGKLKGLFGK